MQTLEHPEQPFDVAPDGGLSNRRVWADLGDGTPAIVVELIDMFFVDAPQQMESVLPIVYLPS